MKKYINILFAAAVSALALVSCVKEQEVKPGTPDAEDCQGVYFPKQDVIEETQIFDPTQEKVAIIKVARGVSEGALTIVPKVSLSEITSAGTVDGDVALFTVSDIVFEDGQTETEIEIEFPEVKEGVQYSLHLAVEGDQYTSKYSSKVNTCDFKVMCVAYQDFLNPVTKERAKITFTLGWWEEKRTAYIKYYEVDGIRYCETYDEALVGTVTNGEHEEKGGFWGVDPNQHLHFMWYLQDDEECSDCGKKHSHTIPAGYAPAPEGAELMTFNGFQEFDFGWAKKPIVVDYYYYQLENGYARPYLHFLDANSLYDNASYYDKNGGFYFWILGYNTLETPGSGWGFPQDYDIIGIAEGFTRADYSLKLDAGITEYNEKAETNVVPVSFQVGPDVDKVGYTILEGIASGAAIDAEIAAIAKDTIDFKYATYVEAKGKSFTDNIALEESGIYTLVAVAQDTLKKVQSSASINFKYLATDDQDKVIVSVSASTTEAYASKGYNPDVSLAYTISGAGITAAIPMIYSEAEVEGLGGIDKIVSDLKASPNTFFDKLKDETFTGALSAEALASANDNGYTDIYYSGVTPGTVYYVLVWATNGYGTEVIYDTMKTTGKPLPIYRNYTYKDRADDLIDGKEASDFYGTYNLYAIDSYGSASLRSYMGKATLAAYDAEKYGPMDPEDENEYAQISGLSCGQAPAGFDDTILLNFTENPFTDIKDKLGFFSASKKNLAQTASLYTWVPAGNDWYNWAYAMVAYPVADGYIAFVGESSYADNYGVFSNINFYGNGIDIAFKDFLLVDPKKDDNGVAPASVSAAISAAKKARNNNRVEIEGNMRFNKLEVLDNAYVKHPFFTPAGIKGLAPVTRVQRVAAKHSVTSKVVKSAKDHFTLAQFDMRKKMN